MIFVAVGAVAVGGLEEDLPGAASVRIVCTVAARGVGVGPIGQVDRIFVPGHLGVEIEGVGIGVEALGK